VAQNALLCRQGIKPYSYLAVVELRIANRIKRDTPWAHLLGLEEPPQEGAHALDTQDGHGNRWERPDSGAQEPQPVAPHARQAQHRLHDRKGGEASPLEETKTQVLTLQAVVAKPAPVQGYARAPDGGLGAPLREHTRLSATLASDCAA